MNPSLEWEHLGEVSYAKQTIYSMIWGHIDLRKYLCEAAPFGGPIALILNFRRIVSLQGQASKPTMSIYTSSGKLIHQFLWDKGVIVKMGWIRGERLVCVLEQGAILIYDINGENTILSFGDEAKEFGILDAFITPEEVVVLTGNFRFAVMAGFEEPRVKLMPNLQLNDAPDSWTVLPGKLSLSGHVEIFCAYNGTVYIVEMNKAEDQKIDRGAIHKMSISPDGKSIAVFNQFGQLIIISTNFQYLHASFKTNSEDPPISIAWSGNDTVLLHWEDTILMIGPNGSYLKFTYDGIVQMVTEIDSARIITSTHCELIQKVPAVTETIFRFGSTAPSAILFDAREQYEQQNPKANESITAIRLFLRQAVDECIEAAGFEFVVDRQKQLLRASSFGKGFLEAYPASKHVEMVKSLRVLNSIRDGKIGIPLTYNQLMELGAEELVDILCNRNHFGLAKSVCEYMSLPSDRVLVKWACHKVKQSVEDEEAICRTIFDKLSEKPGISYAEVAKVAYKNGRISLATQLLEFEPSAADQVPILLSMEQDEIALLKSIESGDADLVYLCLFHMKRKFSIPDFFRLIHDKQMACSLLEVYAKSQDLELLKDFYYQDDRAVSNGNLYLLSSFNKQNSEDKIADLKAAKKSYDLQRISASDAKAIDEQIKLIQIQKMLTREFGQNFEGLTVVETILRCFTIGQPSRAAKIRYDFKINDKRYTMLEFRAIVEMQNWESLGLFARSNPKFNYKYGLDILFAQGLTTQAISFVENFCQGTVVQRDAKLYHENWLSSMRGKAIMQENQ